MRQGEIIKHINCTDIAFLVQKIQYRGPKYTKVRGLWYNISSPTGRKWIISYTPETIKIAKEQIPNWKCIDIPDSQTS